VCYLWRYSSGEAETTETRVSVVVEVQNTSPARIGLKSIARRAILTVFLVTLITSGIGEASCVVSGHEGGWGRCNRPPNCRAAEIPWCEDSGVDVMGGRARIWGRGICRFK
jgi:hypothetical protein